MLSAQNSESIWPNLDAACSHVQNENLMNLPPKCDQVIEYNQVIEYDQVIDYNDAHLRVGNERNHS